MVYSTGYDMDVGIYALFMFKHVYIHVVNLFISG